MQKNDDNDLECFCGYILYDGVKAPYMNYENKTIEDAREKHKSGSSIRKIQEGLRKERGIAPSTSTICAWLDEDKDIIERNEKRIKAEPIKLKLKQFTKAKTVEFITEYANQCQKYKVASSIDAYYESMVELFQPDNLRDLLKKWGEEYKRDRNTPFERGVFYSLVTISQFFDSIEQLKPPDEDL